MAEKLLKIDEMVFTLKKSNELTEKDIKDLYTLGINAYPKFKKYYDKNKYYSTIKPNKVFLIRKKNRLIGDGKFILKKISKSMKLAAFGLLIDKTYRGMGLGTQLIKLQIMEARKRKVDFLYGTTENPIAERILRKLGFIQIKTPVFYTEVLKNKYTKEKNKVFVFILKKGIIKKLKNLKKLYIGKGPL